MARKQTNQKIDDLFRRCEWAQARALIERELEADPENHWLVTQLGVTFYEQRRYEDALQQFERSREIVPDCPLTLWNLAGTMDALGDCDAALRIYSWLLESKKTPEDDPCWESRDWTARLKADVVFRLGVCFRRRGQKPEAEHCFQHYLMLLATNFGGTYSSDDVERQFQSLYDDGERRAKAQATYEALASELQAVGVATGWPGQR